MSGAFVQREWLSMRSMRWIFGVLALLSLGLGLGFSSGALAADGPGANPPKAEAGAPVSSNSALAPAAPIGAEIEALKKSSVELNRDLKMLEEDLLFPASTQVAVFVSLDVGQYFDLDSVKLTIDDTLVASHLYTPKQTQALARGGVQRLYLGNLKAGKHEITAFFIGKGPDNREFKRGATYTFEKTDKPGMLELRILDATSNMQPRFEFKEWQL